MSEDTLLPCPGCGGSLEQQSAYDRSVGQYTCAGECGWSWPADRYARLARAMALLRAVEMLEQHAEIDNAHPFFGTLRTDYHLLPQQGSHAWVAVGRNQMSTTCDTIADALIALAAQMEARDETMA